MHPTPHFFILKTKFVINTLKLKTKVCIKNNITTIVTEVYTESGGNMYSRFQFKACLYPPKCVLKTEISQRDGLAVKNTGCSYRGPRSSFQYPHGGTQSPVTPAPRGAHAFKPARALWTCAQTSAQAHAHAQINKYK